MEAVFFVTARVAESRQDNVEVSGDGGLTGQVLATSGALSMLAVPTTATVYERSTSQGSGPASTVIGRAAVQATPSKATTVPTESGLGVATLLAIVPEAAIRMGHLRRILRGTGLAHSRAKGLRGRVTCQMATPVESG